MQRPTFTVVKSAIDSTFEQDPVAQACSEQNAALEHKHSLETPYPAAIAQLQSYQSGKDGFVSAALMGLLDELQLDEGLDFVHEYTQTIGKNYHWHIDLIANEARQSQLASSALATVGTLFPLHGWQTPLTTGAAIEHPSAESNTAPTPAAAPFVYHLRPKGFSAQKTPESFAAVNAAVKPSQDRASPFGVMNDVPSIDTAWLPAPVNYPSWPLTVPFDGFLPADTHIRVTIGLRAVTLTHTQQTQLHGVLRKLESSHFSVFESDAIISPYSASPHLVKDAVRTAKEWLRNPSGIRYHCTLDSSCALTPAQLTLIGRDVFGKVGFTATTLREFGHTLEVSANAAALGSLADNLLDLGDCAKLTQSLPAISTSLNVLERAGIPQHYAPAAVLPAQTGSYIGQLLSGKTRHPVCLDLASRSSHTMIVGASGSGKSTLMCQLIAQDMQAGNGLLLLDPHGDLVEQALRLVPPHRAHDVLLIDLESDTYIANLNPLAGIKGNVQHAQFVVNEISTMIDQLIEEKDTTGPLCRAYLKNLMLITAWIPARDGTFYDCLRMIEDADLRDYYLSKCKDDALKLFWSNAKATRSEYSGIKEWIPFLSARLSVMTQNPVLKRLLNCPAPPLNLAKAMAEQKIVLFKLSKSVLQDQEAQLTGTLILMQVYAAAMQRSRLPVGERKPFGVYVDETQTFATASFPRMLAETRKMGVGLTMAFQNLRQLTIGSGAGKGSSNALMDAVLANTANKLLMRSSAPADLEALQTVYKPIFEAKHLSGLANFTAIAQLMSNNSVLPPVALAIAPPPAVVNNSQVASQIAELAMQAAGYSVRAVNEALMDTMDIKPEELGVPVTAELDYD
jgi:Helicase HerA, central domain